MSIVSYENEDGTLAVIRVTEEAIAKYGLDTYAQMVVPNGSTYRLGTTPEDEAEILAEQEAKAKLRVGIEQYENAVQFLVDETAKSKTFRDGVTMASYTNSTNLEWAAEAQAFVAWRDRVWMFVYEQYALVLAGGRQQPTVEELIAELPKPNWPA